MSRIAHAQNWLLGCGGCLLLAVLVLVCQPARGVDKPAGSPAGGEIKAARRALLIGITKYPEPIRSLAGPANDLRQMAALLSGTFQFGSVVSLSEEAAGIEPAAAKKNPDLRPTRANIAREFARLARESHAGDQVFILICGHGSQQPDHEPFDEPDGLDEVVLPADIGAWDPQKEVITNAISDDDFRHWVEAISSKGASVCVVFDTCHSGTLLRGVGDEAASEVTRDVPATEIINEAAITRARKAAATRFRNGQPASDVPSAALGGLKGDVVGIYAARSDEKEIEKLQPDKSGDFKPYGLLSYTLCQVLTPKDSASTRPMSYRQVVDAIQRSYIARGLISPTPLVEGPAADKEFFGVKTWPTRPQYDLQMGPDGWKVNAGQLQGLTVDSILAVHPAGNVRETPVVGHVVITKIGARDAEVKPCEFNKLPANTNLTVGQVCEPVYIDFGSLRLRVAIDVASGPGAPIRGAQPADLRQALEKAAKRQDAPIQIVEKAAEADWLVQVKDGQIYLVPAAGVAVRGATHTRTAMFGPLNEEKVDAELVDLTTRLARAEMLKRIAIGAGGNSKSRVSASVELLRLPPDGKESKGEAIHTGTKVRDGEKVAFRVHNNSRSAKIWPTILFIDADYGITPVYPQVGDVPEVVEPNGAILIDDDITINAKTLGMEHLVLIAVEAVGPPTSYADFSQPSLPVTRGTDDAKSSPLGKLLASGMFGAGATRGMNRAETSNHAVQLYTWETLPKDAP